MKIEQKRWTDSGGWYPSSPGELGKLAQLVLLFCGTSIIKNQLQFDVIKESFPMAVIVGCSTAGEIFKTRVDDDSLVLTAIHFEHTTIKEAHVRLSESCDSLKAGETLAKSLYKKDLVHVFTLSDGLVVNGSDLVKGLTENLPENVMVTGGMSGDGENFNETFIYWGKAPEKGAVLAIGFYGDRLKVGFGSLGGWDSFGTERLITKAEGNILFELDGQSALELYKKYLGDHAKGLPATGLLFPLSLRGENGEEGTVRTILAINEEQQSLTFAGDVPEGTYARFMKANFDRLIDGAIVAAKIGYEAIGSISPDLAILISCVGRKMVLKQRIEEEVEGAGEILGENVVLTGFYSYGEISPLNPGGKCALHNQTMAITTFFEE